LQQHVARASLDPIAARRRVKASLDKAEVGFDTGDLG
jgi:hypothetical protein